ncbi:MAG: hypothetical protein IKN83_05730 [Bacteroidaceae bacterium]|nr:hypothetical protein [Bacteroidaceae bacterium]
MRKLLLKTAICAIVAFGCVETHAQTYAQSMVPWKDRPLTWNDFKASYPTKDTLAYEVSYHASPRIEKKKIGNTTYEYYLYDSYVNTAESWVNPTYKTNDLLKLTQANFDLWELCCRKAIMEYSSLTEANIDEIFDFHKRLCLRRQDEHYNLSSRGTDHAAVERFAEEVKGELAHTVYHPEEYVAPLEINRGIYYAIGVESHIPFSDYFKPFFGMTVSLGGYLNKNSMVGMEANFTGFGKCKQNIYSKKGMMEKGEEAMNYSLSLIYGRYLMSGGSVDLMPYVGLGVRSYQGGEVYPEYHRDNKNNQIHRTGISMGIGMMTDFNLKRKVMFRTRSSSIEQLNTCIRLRPYFNVTYYPRTLGWVPALNIGVEFCQKGYKLHKR